MMRIVLLILSAMVLTFTTSAQVLSSTTKADYHYQLSSHILDIVKGKPVQNIRVKLEKQAADGKDWVFVDQKMTDKNGRIADFLKLYDGQQGINQGIYKLTFYTQPYFEAQDLSTFYPWIEVVFTLTDDAHYHVPITLSPYGYSTYRGS